jgi:dTDP-glucose 4,6-dehydratase
MAEHQGGGRGSETVPTCCRKGAEGVRGVYDEAKRYAEAIAMAYHRHHKVDTRIVRIFNTYGPRMRVDDGRMVPNFIQQALLGRPLTVYGDGSQSRSVQ